jgi:EmrB/QacA subfamily drug resistance transporter
VADSLDRQQRQAALLVAGCFFMEMLDATIVTTSAPKLAHALHVPVGSISVIITAYVVTLATLIPLSGWVSARWGARPTFLAAITVFTLASLGCSLAQNLPELVVMRVVQGAGGAMMVPVGRLVVLARSAKADLMRVTAYLVWPGLVAPVIAPLAGGLITTYATWHWLFLINVPLGAIALLLAFRLIHPPHQNRPAAFDGSGMVLTGAGLAGLTVTAALLSRATPDVAADLGAGVPSVLLIVAAVRHLLRSERPLIDLRVLRNHTLRASLSGASIYFAVISSAPFLLPLLFEQVYGWSAVKAGAVVLFVFVGNIAVKPATTFLYRRFGFRAVLVVSTATQAATMIFVAFAPASLPTVGMALVLVVSGCARSVGVTGYSTLAFSEVDGEQMRNANTLFAMAQQIAGGFGIAVAAIALRIGHPLGRLLSSHPGGQAPYTIAFLLVALLALIACFDAARLAPEAGDVLRCRAPKAQTGEA